MIRVLQILSSFNRGGMETFIMNVYRTIDKTQIQFDFLISQEGCDYELEAKSYGARIYYKGSRRKDGFVSYCKKLDGFFKEHAKDYVAVHYHESTLSSMEPLFYAKKYGIKNRILHSHSSSVAGSKLHYITHYVNKLFVRNLATQYVGCSAKAISWFYKGTGVYSKAVMIANGINPKLFVFDEQKKAHVRSELGIGINDLVIGHIGRFMWIKNHKYIIDVFEQIHMQRPDSKLILIGIGPLFDEIKERVREKGLSDVVLFMGLRSDIPELLQAIDVVIMPSIYEGMPVSLVEAQAAGALVYGSDTISKDTAITDRMHFLSIEKDPSFWADIILSNDSVKKVDTSAEIKKSGFDINEIAKDLVKRYTL